jgi:hypothetical protein
LASAYLDATGLMGKTTASRIGQRMQHRDTLIGSSPRSARRHGVRLHGRTVDASGSEVSFSDETRLTVSTIVWATGFALDHSWIDVPVFDENDGLVHRGSRARVACAAGRPRRGRSKVQGGVPVVEARAALQTETTHHDEGCAAACLTD